MKMPFFPYMSHRQYELQSHIPQDLFTELQLVGGTQHKAILQLFVKLMINMTYSFREGKVKYSEKKKNECRDTVIAVLKW